MGCPLGFAPEAVLEGLGLPLWGQVWRWCSCLGLRASGSTRYSEELAVREAGNIVLEKGMATSIGQYAPAFLPGELHFLTEAWQATVYRVAKSWTQLKRTHVQRHKTFLPVAALPQWGLSVKVAWLPGSREPWWAKCAGTQTASAAGVMALSESFFEPHIAEDQKASVFLHSCTPSGT